MSVQPPRPPADRAFKDALYAQFARVGHALASPKRIEILDLLGQGEKTVEVLARQVAMPVKNTSAHLRVLRLAGLVETRRDGTHIHYRLGDDDVHRMVRAVEAVAHGRLGDVQRVVNQYFEHRDEFAPVSLAELRRRLRAGDVTLVDVRPAEEFAAGHIPGALSIPVRDLRRRLREIPRSREVIAYCRGRYCVMSLEAVALLRRHGYAARRSEDGMPDWRAAGFPTARGAASAA